MKILIREGSAAKNFKELIPLIEKYPEKIMFCTDDIHPDDLRDGHINKLIIAGLGMGYDFFDLLKATTLNPKIHYNLNTGLLRKHDPADFVMIDHPERMSVLKTYVNGINVYSKGKIEIRSDKSKRINVFKCKKITAEQIHIPAETDRVRVMEAFDGKLFTKERILKPGLKNRYFVSDINKDILKIVVYNRYNISKPAIAFVKGFGLKTGAIASTVAHDSHNIIAVGVSDEDIIKAINRIIELKGGIVITDGSKMDELQLNIGGIMSDQDGTMVANEYKNLNQKVQELGSELKSPFMTL
jgi:adenine deaminase